MFKVIHASHTIIYTIFLKGSIVTVIYIPHKGSHITLETEDMVITIICVSSYTYDISAYIPNTRSILPASHTPDTRSYSHAYHLRLRASITLLHFTGFCLKGWCYAWATLCLHATNCPPLSSRNLNCLIVTVTPSSVYENNNSHHFS